MAFFEDGVEDGVEDDNAVKMAFVRNNQAVCGWRTKLASLIVGSPAR